jgi:carboxylesterase
MLAVWVRPVVVKSIQPGRITFTDTLEPIAAQNVLHYPSTTFISILEMWKLQDCVDVLKAKYDTLSVLYGKQDLTVDMVKFIKVLDENHVKYDKYAFENSAHNVLEDYEKEKAVEIIISILNK